MVSTSLSCLLCALAVAHADAAASTSTTSTRIDGFEHESGRDSWYVQVDGVMGGKSSGTLDFTTGTTDTDDEHVMQFTGTISLDGGGFSSIRRRYAGDLLDLSDYAGVVVTLETQASSASVPPLGAELSFGDATSQYDFPRPLPCRFPQTQTYRVSIYRWSPLIAGRSSDFSAEMAVRSIPPRSIR